MKIRLPKIPVFVIGAFAIVSLTAALSALYAQTRGPGHSSAIVAVKPVAAVLPFEVAGEITRDAATPLTDCFSQELINSDRFRIVTRQEMDKVLKEHEIILGDCTGSCTVRVGNLLGAEKLLTGRVSKLGKKFIISAQIIDVETGTVERSEMVECNCPIEDLTGAIAELTAKLVNAQKAEATAPTASAAPVPVSKPPSAPMVAAATPVESPSAGKPARNVDRPNPPIAVAQVVKPQITSTAAIPAGCFRMGCVWGDNDCDDDEIPKREVCLDRFFMDLYEVTNGQYQQCVEAGACKPAHYADGSCYTFDGEKWQRGVADETLRQDSRPVACVDWSEARSYCAWAKKRLPTESEWEYSARGGLDGKFYSWGNQIPSSISNTLGNLADEAAKAKFGWPPNNVNIFRGYDDGFAESSPVGGFQANGYGLFDMTGNVWEWVSDWYDKAYYQIGPGRNPQGPDTGSDRVLRGGSWSDIPRLIRLSNRFRNRPNGRAANIGFRCASDKSD